MMSAPKPPTLVLVEDDDPLAELLQTYLERQDFEVLREATGDAGAARILDVKPDLAIVDLFLPGMDGLAVCRAVREAYTGPLLILTASKSDADHVAGLELGADDFVTKPVDPRVLLARIRTLLRRVEGGSKPAADEVLVLESGPLRLDLVTREAYFEGARLELTTMEFDVLQMLVRNAGEVVTREDLYEQVAGTRYDGLDRGMDVHISRIRRKLSGFGCEPRRLKAVRGAGYLWAYR